MQIYNNSGIDMPFLRYWYDSGRVATGYSWPQVIADKSQGDVLNYEKDYSMVGCSGYVTYEMEGTEVTISFSNPSVGHNKLGVGTSRGIATSKTVWDEMSHHGYDVFDTVLLVRR